MAKKFEGLDAMIQSTAQNKEEGKNAQSSEYINSNIPLLKEQHMKLKILAMMQNKTLKQLLPEIIQQYLDEHKINL